MFTYLLLASEKEFSNSYDKSGDRDISWLTITVHGAASSNHHVVLATLTQSTSRKLTNIRSMSATFSQTQNIAVDSS